MNEDLAQYEVDIDLANSNTSHAQVARLVGQDRRVLDIGCWTGDLGRILMAQGCRVSGVEVDPDAADIARADLDPVVVLDLDREPVSVHFEPASFDVIVLADVLEHLIDPAAVLTDVIPLLTGGGAVVASIPNVTHGSVRLALLQGRWAYTDTGLLDSSHLRFFDRRKVLDLFCSSGFTIDQLRGTTADPLAVEVEIDADHLPGAVVEWVRDQPDSLVYQFVVSAHPTRPGEVQEVGALTLHPAQPDDQVRLTDRHTDRAVGDQEARHRLLTVRDHMIGLEAATATAQTRADHAERQLKGARKRLDRKNERIQQLAAEVRRLRAGDEPAPESRVRSAMRRIRTHAEPGS